MKLHCLLAAAAVSAFAVSGCAADQTIGAMPGETTTRIAADSYAAAIADPLRPAEEVARDPLRHPAEMLAFAQVKEGDRIADIRPEEGYFTRLFARAVGGAGRVYAFVPNQTAARENAYGDALAAAYPNVNRVTGDLNALTFPEPLDVVFMGQEYHDFVIPRFNVDVAKMNAAIFAALKPGGRYVILDHQAAPGAGTSVVGTLHRIEGSALRAQVEAAGFVFDGETSAVANPEDDHALNVFDPAIRGKTDQFVYRFKKPDR
jgi:predicted methyltransferase